MTPLASLWLPILLSAIVVFVVSSIIHMLSPWHKNDFPRLPSEDQFMDALRPVSLPVGEYMIPRCKSHADMRTPEFLAKIDRGPVMMVTVMPSGAKEMGKRMNRSLVLWFLYAVVVGIFAAYIAGRALPPGTLYTQVFRFVGATAFIAYVVALWQLSIWYSRSWMVTFKSTVDGLIYALLTAGMFGWLWPR
jgi:hypothetical protein